MKRKLVVVEQHMHPCFLCPAKYVEEEFEDDADDCPDAAAESTPRLRCDGIATKHGTLSISSQTPLFAESAVGGSEEITLFLNSLRVPSHPRSTSLSLKLQMDVGVALRTRVACSAQDDIWSGPSGMAPGQHGRGKWHRKEATLRRPILTLQHALLVMSLVGGLVLVWLCNFRAQHHARSSVFKEATY